MELVETLVVVAHVLASVALVVLVLLQRGKGAEMGASFGAGASQTLFGSEGSGSFMTRLTAFIAFIFFVSSFTLAVFAKQHAEARLEQDFVPGIPEVVEEGPLELDSSEPVNESDSDAGPPELE